MSARRRAQPDPTVAPETPPTADTASERLAKLRQARVEAERARQALIDEADRLAKEQEREILEEERRLQEEIEAVKKEKEREKKKEEARRRAREEEEARKAEEAKVKEAEALAAAAEAEARRVDEGKKKEKITRKNTHSEGKGKGPAVDKDDQEKDGEEHSKEGVDDGQSGLSIRPSKSRKPGPKTPAIINESGKDLSKEIVEGGLYPSCMACVKGGLKCDWKRSVVHLRLAGLPSKARNCENCIRKQVACQFVWERDDSLKRTAEGPQEPESSKRVKIDCPDILACMQSIDRNLGVLVKFSVTQAMKTSKDHEATSDMFDTIKESLEGLHQKYNDN